MQPSKRVKGSGMDKKRKKSLEGYIYVSKKDIELRWSVPHWATCTPKVVMSGIYKNKSESRLNWITSKKVRITIEEI